MLVSRIARVHRMRASLCAPAKFERRRRSLVDISNTGELRCPYQPESSAERKRKCRQMSKTLDPRR